MSNFFFNNATTFFIRLIVWFEKKQYSKKISKPLANVNHIWTSLYSQFVLLVCDQNVDGNLQKKITVIRATKKWRRVLICSQNNTYKQTKWAICYDDFFNKTFYNLNSIDCVTNLQSISIVNICVQLKIQEKKMRKKGNKLDFGIFKKGIK